MRKPSLWACLALPAAVLSLVGMVVAGFVFGHPAASLVLLPSAVISVLVLVHVWRWGS